MANIHTAHFLIFAVCLAQFDEHMQKSLSATGIDYGRGFINDVGAFGLSFMAKSKFCHDV